jgi:hypothetical protein
MKAPKYQRAEMLEAALQEAVHTFEGPVEGLEITELGVVAWAAGRFILMSCRWDNSYSADGEPLPGSGVWSAQYINDCDASYRQSSESIASMRPWWRRWWRHRTLGRR